MKQELKIPQATTKRLPLYYRFIQNFAQEGMERISSKELSEAMKIDSATIRRDFSYFGALGKRAMAMMCSIYYNFLARRLINMKRQK